jgi:hypothetical protein
LEPNAGIDKNDDSKLDNDKDLKRPMMSYKITDDEINWKKEADADTTVTNAIASEQRKTNYGVYMIGVLKTRQTPH